MKKLILLSLLSLLLFVSVGEPKKVIKYPDLKIMYGGIANVKELFQDVPLMGNTKQVIVNVPKDHGYNYCVMDNIKYHYGPMLLCEHHIRVQDANGQLFTHLRYELKIINKMTKMVERKDFIFPIPSFFGWGSFNLEDGQFSQNMGAFQPGE